MFGTLAVLWPRVFALAAPSEDLSCPMSSQVWSLVAVPWSAQMNLLRRISITVPVVSDIPFPTPHHTLKTSYPGLLVVPGTCQACSHLKAFAHNEPTSMNARIQSPSPTRSMSAYKQHCWSVTGNRLLKARILVSGIPSQSACCCKLTFRNAPHVLYPRGLHFSHFPG